MERLIKILIFLLFFTTSCNVVNTFNKVNFNYKYENLPINIYIDDELYNEENLEKLSYVINVYNSFFNIEMFAISDDPLDSQIFINYEENIEKIYGFCMLVSGNSEKTLIQSLIYLSNEIIGEIVLAHELWHAIGFSGHYENEDCLNYPFANKEDKFDDSLFCEEMIEDIYELYPEIN